jgi:hypothetical protein
MTITENDSSIGSNNASVMSRRDFLKSSSATMFSFASLLSFLSGNNKSAKAADSTKSKSDTSASNIMYDLDYYKNLYCGDIFNLSAARNNKPNSNVSRLAYNASQARFFSMRKGIDQKEMAELLASGHTNLVLREMVGGIPFEATNPDAISLENLVKLEVAKDLTTNITDQDFYESMRSRYKKALKKKLSYQQELGVHNGKITKEKRLEVRNQILEDFLLSDAYYHKKHLTFGKVAGGALSFGWNASPVSDFVFVLKHLEKPSGKVDEKSLVGEIYSGLMKEFKAGIITYVRNNSNLGSVKEKEGKKNGEKYCELQLRYAAIQETVMRYVGNLSSYSLEGGRYLNMLCNMAFSDKKCRNRKELQYYGNLLKVGLAWREMQEAEKFFDMYVKDTKDRREREECLATAASKALSAYLLVANNQRGYEAKLFFERYKQYNDEMGKLSVSKDVRTEAYARDSFLFYLPELKALNKRNWDRGIGGSIKTTLGLVLPFLCAPSGGGAAAAGGTFSFGGGGV